MDQQQKHSRTDCVEDGSSATKHLICFSDKKEEEKAEDQRLWLKFKLGHEEAFKSLFLKYFGVLKHIGSIICGDEMLIEDSIHDMFLYLWKKRASLARVESVKYYLVVSFRRRLYRLLQEKERGAKVLEGIKYEYPDYEDFFQSKYIEEQNLLEKERALMHSVSLLPERQRELIDLRFIKGHSYQEISKLMGISMVSARKLSYKAIKNLRKKSL